MGTPDGCIEVRVVYATPDDQRLYTVRVRGGATVRMAVAESGLLEHHRHIDIDHCAVGIFGERADLATVVSAGDRIEIYRPLIADPKESRRRRAAKRTAR